MTAGHRPRRRAAALAALLVAAPVGAFDFGARVAVTAAHGPGIHHRLVSSGRNNVAAGGGTVAVAWEDNRGGRSEAYVAFRRGAEEGFAVEHRVSGGGEAFEPAIAALGGGRFLVAWEEAGRVWLRLASADGLGPAHAVDETPGRQATVAAAGGRAQVAWVQPGPAGPLVRHGRVDWEPGSGRLRVADAVTVDPVEQHAYQAYPALAALADGAAVVVWEDRRFGHTRLLFARREPGGGFGAAQGLNAFNAPRPDPGETAEPVRLGSGVMRPVVASADRLAAAWLDKRDLGSGYAIWGAVSRDGGRAFARDEKIQDDSGGSQAVPHWNATIAGNPGGLVVVAWDDAREAWSDPDETGDVFVSWSFSAGWSGDHPVAVASGAGRQSQPAVAIDERGTVHLAWTEQPQLRGPSRLWYARGTLPTSP
jgi:hypothetical protein